MSIPSSGVPPGDRHLATNFTTQPVDNSKEVSQIDYDRIASKYDQRFTAGTPSGEGQALRNLAREVKTSRVLEVGCGTGHWLQEMASGGPALFGLDLSTGMLHQAKVKKTPVDLIQGYARQLPFQDNSFDLVFCVNAIHHFADPQAFITEAFRSVRLEGALAVVGSGPQEWKSTWYVYRYFEGTYERDLRRFPAWGTVCQWMRAAGFKDLRHAEVEHIAAHKRGREVLDDPYLQKHACSQLALLTDEAYAAGLRRIEEDLAQAERRGETLTFETELTIAMLSGRKT